MIGGPVRRGSKCVIEEDSTEAAIAEKRRNGHLLVSDLLNYSRLARLRTGPNIIYYHAYANAQLSVNEWEQEVYQRYSSLQQLHAKQIKCRQRKQGG